MTSVIRYTPLVILRIKNPRIWPQPTKFQYLSEIFKLEFQGNWARFFISPDSACLTESLPNMAVSASMCRFQEIGSGLISLQMIFEVLEAELFSF